MQFWRVEILEIFRGSLKTSERSKTALQPLTISSFTSFDLSYTESPYPSFLLSLFLSFSLSHFFFCPNHILSWVSSTNQKFSSYVPKQRVARCPWDSHALLSLSSLFVSPASLLLSLSRQPKGTRNDSRLASINRLIELAAIFISALCKFIRLTIDK